jgi:hypothetical protein
VFLLLFDISLSGCSRYIQIADYGFASEIKFVPTLYLSTSFECYDWEDVMKDFLWDRGLESPIKIFNYITHDVYL